MNESEILERVHEILSKVVEYQHTHPDAPADLDALVSAGVLSPEHRVFLETHSIDYKPHAVTSHHASIMCKIPTDDGCIFVWPNRPPPPQHAARLPELAAVIEEVLRQSVSDESRGVFIECTTDDGVGFHPGIFCFILRRPEWRARVANIKAVAAEHGLSLHQDSPELQGNYLLGYTVAADPSTQTRIALDFLRRGLGLTDEDEVRYVAE